MIECKKQLIAHSKAREKLVVMVKFHRFKRICFCVKRKKLFCVGVKFFSNFFFENVLGTTWGSFTQNFSQIQYVDLYRRGHPSERSYMTVYMLYKFAFFEPLLSYVFKEISFVRNSDSEILKNL